MDARHRVGRIARRCHVRAATTCWFEDTLWAANETGIVRRIDGGWKAVAIPANQLPELTKPFDSHKFVIDRYNYHAGRFAVVDGQLYFLGVEATRGRLELGDERLPVPARDAVAGMISLVATKHGTLIAGGPRLWRKTSRGSSDICSSYRTTTGSRSVRSSARPSMAATWSRARR